MASIKAIDAHTVHRIQSGQVIIDLTSVVKELVENSLDAGATSIDIRFKTQGLDLIEVQDNGSGICPQDFQSIALKHFTSKLSVYGDLLSLNTFGFRGEALSSLCAVSRLHIATARGGKAPKGNRLDFEASGAVSCISVTACQKGTLIAVEDLFHGLPVRRRELEKNNKREFSKALALLHAYACISTGVKFTVTNQASKGQRVVIFATQANATTRETITNIYGTKTTSALIALDLRLNVQSAISRLPVAETDQHPGAHKHLVRVVGHVSRPVFGEGRLTPDRQMFFVNSRPCSLPQVTKAFNDVYRTFNYTQSPFVFANIIVDTTRYDVNVSPDKRTILLHDQAQMLDLLKLQLCGLFEIQDQTVPISQTPFRMLPSRSTQEQTTARLSASPVCDLAPNDKDQAVAMSSCPMKQISNLETHSPVSGLKPNISNLKPVTTSPDISERVATQQHRHVRESEHRASEVARIEAMVRSAEATAKLPTQQTLMRIDKSMSGRHRSSSIISIVSPVEISLGALEVASVLPGRENWTAPANPNHAHLSPHTSEEERLSLTIAKSDFARMRISGQFNLGFILAVRSNDLFIIDQHASDEIYNFSKLSETTILTPQRLVRPHALHLTAIEEETALAHRDTLLKNGFSVDVNTTGLRVVGKRCKLLTVPTSHETVLGLEDLEELLALLNDVPAPVSSPFNHKTLVRPSKVRRMLAMKACRSSIMVGRSLTTAGMEKILRQMGEIDRPWNCPHGRPTMRHVAGLWQWDTWDESDGAVDGRITLSAIDWNGWSHSL